MAIEFRCTQCDKLLRTGDDTAGKQAKCPECGTVMTIPEATLSGGDSSVPPVGDNPFGGAGSRAPFPADTGNPYQSPRDYTTAAGGTTSISRGTLDLGDILGRTWTILKKEWGMCLLAVVVVFAIRFAFNITVGNGLNFLGAMSKNHAIMILTSISGSVATSLFAVWIEIGLALFLLKKARGREVAIGEVFTGGPYFGNVLIASILVGLIALGIILVLVGPLALVGLAIYREAAMILAGVGGVVAAGVIWYVMLMFSQFYYLILDQNAGITDSLRMSKDLMEGNKLTLLLINLAAGSLGALAAILTCGLGLLVVAPYLALMHAVIYLTVTGQRTAEQR
jgi:phage FluMu protein Com